MLNLILFCEGAADARTTMGLIDRVLSEYGPAWALELMDDHPEAVRECIKDNASGKDFFDVHHLGEHVAELKKDPSLRKHLAHAPQGRFGKDKVPGENGARMARMAFHIAQALSHINTIHVTLLVWDMDKWGNDRRKGCKQARDDLSKGAPFKIILALPDPEREAWVLSGFEPEDDEERIRLEAIRSDLGFCPLQESHRLKATKDQPATKDPKDVLNRLIGKSREREARCWTHAPLARLHARGKYNGLADFLGEAQSILPPLLQ